jgi:hypothetical protein
MAAGWLGSRWYAEYGAEPARRWKQELPGDQELEELLKKWIDKIEYEDEKIAKVRNEEYRIVQV